MLNLSDDDAELPPAEPAEEIPEWLASQRPEEAPPPPPADAPAERVKPVTLAEKHKARRRAYERLSRLTSTDETIGAVPVGADPGVRPDESTRPEAVETGAVEAGLEPHIDEIPPDVGAGLEILTNADQTGETRPDTFETVPVGADLRVRPYEGVRPDTFETGSVGAGLEPHIDEIPPDVGAGLEILTNADQTGETRPDTFETVPVGADLRVRPYEGTRPDEGVRPDAVETGAVGAGLDSTIDETPPDQTQPNGPDQTILQFLVALPRKAGERAEALWKRLTRRAPPAPGVSTSVLLPETTGEPETPQQPGGPGRFKAGAARAWAFSRPILWRGRIGPAFWTVASLLSVTVNVILIAILILLGRQLFFLKKTVVSDKLINGLYTNFALMDQAHIQTTITVSDTILVNDTIPVVFDLPLNQKTTVVLTKDTPVNTTIFLNNAAVPLDLVLRDGTELNIKLDMTVPVKQTIPISLKVPVYLTVPVDIPLNQTQLHKPFVGLQQVVSPYRSLLGEVPNSWSEVCKGSFKFVCNFLRFK